MSVEIPGYVAGTWAIDPVHSEVSFVVRHMMVSKVRGRFDKFDGTFVTGADPLASSVTATVDLTSINTGQEQRDAHIRSADFFEVEKYPEMTFVSTGIRQAEEGFFLEGDLTIKDVTKAIALDFEVTGVAQDPWGNQRLGLEGSTVINRKDWNVNFNVALEAGGMLVSDKITIEFEVSAVKEQDAA